MTTFFERPFLRWLVVACALAVALPSIGIGFYSDDHYLRAAIHGRIPHSPPHWDLYRFMPGPPLTATLRDEGLLPWWSSSNLTIRLVRPLSSELLVLDDRLFGDSPVGYHLHSLVWWAAFLVVLAALYRRLLPRDVAVIALLLFAISPAHFFAYSWPSARHLIVAGTFALLAVVAHLRLRDRGLAWAWVAPLALAVGLTGGEIAVSAVSYLAAYELIGRRREPLARRIAALGPFVAVVAAYLSIYLLLHAGARGSDGYIDPISRPITFATQAVLRCGGLLGNALLGVPVELVVLFPDSPVFAIVGGLATVGLGLAVRRIWPALSEGERTTLAWLGVGGLGALLVTLGGFPGGRLLVLANVAVMPILATIVALAWRRPDPARSHGQLEGRTPPERSVDGRPTPEASDRRFARVVTAGIVVAHVVFPFVAIAGATATNAQIAAKVEAVADALPRRPVPQRYFLVASDPMVTLYTPAVLVEHRASPNPLACWSPLSTARKDHRIERTGEREIVVQVEGGSMLCGAFETLYRSSAEPFNVGDEVTQCGARFVILAVDQGRPTRFAVRFDTPLDAPDLTFVVWRNDRLEPVALPPIGGALQLAWSAGPSGVF